MEADLATQGWASSGTLCTAPAEYDGICSPSMDFASYSVDNKIEWGAMCGAEWLAFEFSISAIVHIVEPCVLR